VYPMVVDQPSLRPRLHLWSESCAKGFVFRSWSNVGHIPRLEVPERVLPELEKLLAIHPIKTGSAAT